MQTIAYMPLIDEGTDVWRPVTVRNLGAEKYEVIGPMPDGEVWAFTPGTLVRLTLKVLSEGETLVVERL